MEVSQGGGGVITVGIFGAVRLGGGGVRGWVGAEVRS